MTELRPYQPRDLLALYDVCLRTGLSGEDARHLYRNPLLLGHYYAAPYATLHPECAFVLDDGQRVQGYVIGVPDSRRFEAEAEASWFPLLRGLYPLPSEADQSPDARMIRRLHLGYPAPEAPWAPEYPAHLHIDLLSAAQGGGWGRRLLEALLITLKAREVPGVHLGVGESNVRAQGFYERLGFRLLERKPLALVYGLRL